ncbi:phosphoribosylformylglycinamidine synthase-like, partial [Saccoglossus kowalevskii]|uniref:Phosphoribosylformylglycinamidine synthase-like n=1 Tax=Saccoglossus kowalevskii TaxID=10224 RepID=A0ABM0MXR1_SACKO
LNFSTAWSTNAVSMCHSAGLHQIHRIECSKRFLIQVKNKDGEDVALATDEAKKLTSVLHDRMTECEYQTPLDSFNIDVKPEPVYVVNVMEEGRKALEKANNDLGLAFDDWDLDYYTTMFKEKIKRNPTSVECFDLAQSNSEHSRHWFFKGRMVIDDIEHEDSLFTMVMNTQENSNDNNVIKFSDNSSAIKGFDVKLICPTDPLCSSVFTEKRLLRHIIFTAETHNFPTGVAPFSGATTGTGGRIRDVQAAGRGAHVVAGTAGYCFGNLHIPDYDLPWEDKSFIYPGNFASPLEVAIEASNGASDYGNKFGEPVLAGFARSFGMNITETERREWVKPIMFSGGIGSLEHQHIAKLSPKSGNVLKEICEPAGAIIRVNDFQLADPTINTLELWGAEYQESNAVLIKSKDKDNLQKLCNREKCPVSFVGNITGDGI